MIKLESVQKNYGEDSVLNDIGFHIREGEKVSLVGPGGCGKSTILKVLLGLTDTSGGVVELMGEDLAKSPEKTVRDRKSVV